MLELFKAKALIWIVNLQIVKNSLLLKIKPVHITFNVSLYFKMRYACMCIYLCICSWRWTCATVCMHARRYTHATVYVCKCVSVCMHAFRYTHARAQELKVRRHFVGIACFSPSFHHVGPGVKLRSSGLAASTFPIKLPHQPWSMFYISRRLFETSTTGLKQKITAL